MLQAISKWECGEVLPDLLHFQILAQFYHVSADSLLEIELEDAEHVIETIKVGGAVFEVVKRPEAILAGKYFTPRTTQALEIFMPLLILWILISEC